MENPTSKDETNPNQTTAETYAINGIVSDKYNTVKSITVNGENVTINSDGSWSKEILLKPNTTNTITIIAEDNLGNTTTETRYVHYLADASYKVQHWQQNVDGVASREDSSNYTLKETEVLNGTVGTQVTPSVKTYTGFNSPATKTVTIAADGSTVVNYYYTRKTYTVTLTAGVGISTVTGTGTYVYGASVTIDATLTPGYHFVNWTGNSTVTTKSHTFTISTSNISYTANGAENVIHFKYYSNNGSQTNFVNWNATPTQSWPDNHYNYSNGTYTQSYRGYTATGYYGTTTSGGTLVGEDESFSSYTALCDKYGVDYYAAETTINLYCQWKANTYIIKYMANGGTGSMSNQSFSYGTKVTIASNTFTRTNYRFLGWSTKSDNADDGYGWTGWSGTWSYIDGQYGISNKTLVLYARWERNAPSAYNIINTYTSSQTWTAPEDGYFQVEVFGASGSGGNYNTKKNIMEYFTTVYSGGGGGGGGYSCSRVLLKKGDTVTLTIGSVGSTTKAVVNSSHNNSYDHTLQVTSGANGGVETTDGGGAGGAGGTASGGNYSNANGGAGGNGIEGAQYAYMGDSIGVTPVYPVGGAGGSGTNGAPNGGSGGGHPGTKGGSFYGPGSGASGFVKIYRGNTN